MCRQVSAEGGLLKTPLQQYDHTAVTLAANDATGALLDAQQAGKAKRIIETIEFEPVEILLDQLLFGADLRHADADDDGADERIAAVVDALGEAPTHDREAELRAGFEKVLQKLGLAGFVAVALL